MKNLTVLHNAISVISVNRPQALNALNQETLQELQTVIKECIGRSDCKGIIITGEGEKAFVAGADIKEIASIPRKSI
jgi:enoyl-CoA hydratase